MTEPLSALAMGMDLLSMKEQLLTAFLNSMPVETYIKDLSGNYVYVNRAFESARGIISTSKDSISYTDVGLYGPELAQKHAMQDRQVLETGQGLTSSGLAHDINRTVMTMKFPLIGAEGKAIAIGGLVVNKRAESAPSHAAEPMACALSSLMSSNRPLKRAKYGVRMLDQDNDDGVATKQAGEEVKIAECEEPKIPPYQLTSRSQSYQRLFINMQMGASLSEVVTDENSVPIDFIFREVNPAFEKLTGLTESETVGRRATEVLPGIDKDPVDWIRKFGQVALDGRTYNFERDYSVNLKRYYGGIAYRPDGHKGLFVTLFLDVSDSIQAEENVRESEERHRNLFESMMQGVVYQEASGAIISANPSAERILGLTKDQMMGRSSVDPRWKSIREDGSDLPGEQHPAMLALKTGKPVTGFLMGVFHPTTEKHHWIIVDAIPRFRPGEKEPFQVYSTFTDMTQTKEFERRLMREKERAEMADRLKSAFLANMSHEIRTPLNGIIGHIDLALNNELIESCRTENLEGLHVARQSGELLITIIQDILDLSKIEAGQMAIENNGNFNVRSLMDQVSSLGQTMINQRDKAISFDCTIEDGIVDEIQGDFFRLQQVLNNLVSNAIKFTDKGKVSFRIGLCQEASVLRFYVEDTGKGIPKDYLESIFEPFRQVEIGDTRKHGGTGLGLTISKKLVELMGGTLSVTSSVEKPNNGSRFKLTFPYRPHTPEPTKQTNGDSVPNAKRRSHAESTVINGKVLVAEDEVVSRRLVKRMLDISGYDAILAENGEQAVEKFKTNDDIGLILMDVQMPNMDGLAATTIIRNLESQNDFKRRRRVPIIALSAGAMKGDNERGLAVGMTDYLTKPVNFKLLQETLRTHLGVRLGFESSNR